MNNQTSHRPVRRVEAKRTRRDDDELLVALHDAVEQLEDVTSRLRSAIEETASRNNGYAMEEEQGHA